MAIKPRRGAVTALLLAGALALAGGGAGTLAQGVPSPSGDLPTCLPPGASLPPGVVLPPGVTIPVCPSSGSSTLTSLVQAFLAHGSLPTGMSPADVAALLGAGSGQLPPQLAAAVAALRRLAGADLNEPLAAEVACVLGATAPGGEAFPDLTGVPWAAPAVAALAGTGVMSGVLPTGAGGDFRPQSALSQGQWLALLMQATGALQGGAASSPLAALRAARAAGLFPAGGGIAPAANAAVTLAGAVTLLTRATGWAGIAQTVGAQAAGGGPAAGAPTWAAGALMLTTQLGLTSDMGSSPNAALTRADAAALLARTLALFDATLRALNRAAITGVQPTPLAPGATVTVSGQDLGATAGTAVWRPDVGASQALPVRSWSDTQVIVAMPADATVGQGKLVLTTAAGTSVAAPAQVLAPVARVARTLPDGTVAVAIDGRTFYTSSAAASAIVAMTPTRQLEFAREAELETAGGFGARAPGPAPRGAALRVRTVPARVHARRLGQAPPCGADGCVTLYGPLATPYAASLSGTNVSYDVPCATILGYQVCSGWADAQAELAGTVGGAGSPTGYFSEVGAALSGASLVSAATMDATLALTYTPRRAGDVVTVRARVITNQVDGGVGVAGAGTAPVVVYATNSGFGTQAATVASSLDTMGASVASWPDLSAADAAEQALSKLDAINDTAQTLWQLEGLPGQLGTSHVSSFEWSGVAQPGQAFEVALDTQAVVAANGLSETEVNAVSGVVLVQVTEQTPPSPPPASGPVCVDPPGVHGALRIDAAEPDAGVPGAQIAIRGAGFGTVPGSVAVYTPTLGVLAYATVDSWRADEITVRLPESPPGIGQLWVFPSPYSCSTETPATFDVLEPAVASAQIVLSGPTGIVPAPALTVRGQGFGAVGPNPSGAVSLLDAPGIASALASETIRLEPVSAAFPGEALPATAVDVTPYVTGWSDAGFVVPIALGATRLAPGRYRVVLTRVFSTANQGGALAPVRAPSGTSVTMDFVWAHNWPTTRETVVQDLGTVTLPGTELAHVALPGAASAALPGGSVVVSGVGFGQSPGTVVLGAVEPGLATSSGGFMAGAAIALEPQYVLGTEDVASWDDTRVAFTVPATVAPGEYALWVLHQGWGPWSEVSGPLALSVAAPCACAVGGGGNGGSACDASP